MLLPWHALWGCKHDIQCPSSCSCVTDIPSACSWQSDGSYLIPKHPSGCSQHFPGAFPSPFAVQGFGVASHHVPSSNCWWCLTQIRCNPSSLVYGRAWPPSPRVTVLLDGCKTRRRRWEKCLPQGLNCAGSGTRWEQGQRGSWSCNVCFISRGDLKAMHNLTLQGFSQTPLGFRCRFCWRKGGCLIRDLLPGGFLAFSLEAPGGPPALICNISFLMQCGIRLSWQRAVMAPALLLPGTEGHQPCPYRVGTWTVPHWPRSFKDTTSGPDKSS